MSDGNAFVIVTKAHHKSQAHHYRNAVKIK